MAVTVKIPTQLRTLTDGREQVTAEGESLQQILDELEQSHPGLCKRVLDDTGALRRFVNVYIDGEDVRFLKGLETPTAGASEVAIIPAVAGGSR